MSEILPIKFKLFLINQKNTRTNNKSITNN